MSRDYQVIILGSGPAGFSCAMQASKFDKKALIIEADSTRLGGTWLNTGTVPSKSLREAAKTIYDFHNQFGEYVKRKPIERFSMADLLRHKDRILENETQEVKQNLIKNKIDTLRGFGKLVDDHTVEVKTPYGETQTYTADYILISTGSRPTPPENFEVDHDKILDTSSILNLTHIPKRLVIVGIGVNSIEYATIFSSLGSRVTILTANHYYLPFLDGEIHKELTKALTDRRISIYTGAHIEGISFNPLRTCTDVRYTLDKDGELHVIETDHVLYFGGRVPNTDKIGLENTSVELNDKGYIQVNENYKSFGESIYAAGDVVGFPALASASFSQGRQAASDMFEIPKMKVPNIIPFGIYSIPSVASIGITEKEAKERDLNYAIGRAYYGETTKAIIANDRRGLLKLIFDEDSLKLLGVHIIGEHSTDLIHLGQAVMAHEGDINYFVHHVLNYPTYSEAYRIAAFNGINFVYKRGVEYKEGSEKKQRREEERKK